MYRCLCQTTIPCSTFARTVKHCVQVGISSLVVTKLDGTARGGFVVSIVSDLEVPVKLIGVGEGVNDLRDFEPVLFVDSLLGYTVRMFTLIALPFHFCNSYIVLQLFVVL